jgi:hypothetical protein
MGNHFWTLDRSGELLSQPPWDREGPACWVMLPNRENPPANTAELWRFFDGKSHFWTLDSNGEGWKGRREGPAALVFNAQVPGTVPFYRFYNSASGEHFWTLDKDGELLPKPAFHLEGPACFVYPAPQSGDTGVVPLWRFFRRNPPKHTAATPSTPAPSPSNTTRIAELVFVDTWTEPSWPKPGQPFSVFFRFGNAGTSETGKFIIRIVLDNRESTDVSVPSMRPGITDVVFWSFPVGLPEGRHFIDAYLDVFGQVSEANESNNRATNSPVIK